jgi:hypothetical protein
LLLKIAILRGEELSNVRTITQDDMKKEVALDSQQAGLSSQVPVVRM